jgi:hypothetical protein
MHLSLHSLKVGLATIISLWMAVLACFMGCTLPALANSRSTHGSPMADMENCHHSGGKAPANPANRKPVPGGAMSCCPLEITLAPRPDTATLAISPTQDFPPSFRLLTVRLYSSVELVPSVWHSGRDTLLKTLLLRI